MGVDRTICCVAENEAFDPSDKDAADCEACGLKTLRVTHDSEDLGVYNADVMLGGGNLQSYSFDDGPLQGVPDEYDSPVVPIPYPPDGFTHLCVRYNREGGVQINVVAIDHETGQKIRPAKQPANGLDHVCPIATATLDGDPVDLTQFTWSDQAQTIISDAGAARGGFTTSFASTPGQLRLVAKPGLGTGQFLTGYQFLSWERNRLSKWTKGTEHQWPGDGDSIEFDKNTFEGVVAYYKKVTLDPHWTDPITIPQPIDYGYPPPLRETLLDLDSMFSRFEELLEGTAGPARGAPDPAGRRHELRTLVRGGRATRDRMIAILNGVFRRERG